MSDRGIAPIWVSAQPPDALVEQTDLGAVIARFSGGVASEALDAAGSPAVGWISSLTAGYSAPCGASNPLRRRRALLDVEATQRVPHARSVDGRAQRYRKSEPAVVLSN